MGTKNERFIYKGSTCLRKKDICFIVLPKIYGKTSMARIASTKIVSGLTNEELSEYKEAFSLFDSNNDGIITAKEVMAVMRSLGHKFSDEEMSNMISEFDNSGTGSIDWTEFLLMMQKRKIKVDNEIEVREAFKAFDFNNSGYLSPKELKTIMAMLGEELNDLEIQYMVEEADLDRDGLINYEDFLGIMT